MKLNIPIPQPSEKPVASGLILKALVRLVLAVPVLGVILFIPAGWIGTWPGPGC